MYWDNTINMIPVNLYYDSDRPVIVFKNCIDSIYITIENKCTNIVAFKCDKEQTIDGLEFVGNDDKSISHKITHSSNEYGMFFSNCPNVNITINGFFELIFIISIDSKCELDKHGSIIKNIVLDMENSEIKTKKMITCECLHVMLVNSKLLHKIYFTSRININSDDKSISYIYQNYSACIFGCMCGFIKIINWCN